jgi:hypothetical protein
VTEIITIEPWIRGRSFPRASSWSSRCWHRWIGTRFASKPMREAGYALFVVGALAAAWMAWSMSGSGMPTPADGASLAAGYESPTFSGNSGAVAGELPPLAWQAIRDGERVRGVLRPVDGDRWEVRELPD